MDKINETSQIQDDSVDYYAIKTLSFSSIRQFAQNPARALDAWNGLSKWFEDNKALQEGQLVHVGIEAFIKDDKSELDKFLSFSDNFDTLRNKNGDFNADGQRALNSIEILKQNKDIKALAVGWNKSMVQVELPLFGIIDGIRVKGKIDAMVIWEKTKTIYVYDFKTSRPYPNTGYEYIEDINGKRRYDNVVWDVTKLYPWQAGLYRELLRQNGYEDWDVVYKYLVITKEKTPRVDVINIPSPVLDEGLEQLTLALNEAAEVISNEKQAEMVADDSPWYKRLTYETANIIDAAMPQ